MGGGEDQPASPMPQVLGLEANAAGELKHVPTLRQPVGPVIGPGEAVNTELQDLIPQDGVLGGRHVVLELRVRGRLIGGGRLRR